MTAPPSNSSDSPAIREAKRSAARTGYISGLVIFGLLAMGDVLLLVSDLWRGRDITLILFSLFVLLVATGVVVTRRRRLRRQELSGAPTARSGRDAKQQS